MADFEKLVARCNKLLFLWRLEDLCYAFYNIREEGEMIFEANIYLKSIDTFMDMGEGVRKTPDLMIR